MVMWKRGLHCTSFACNKDKFYLNLNSFQFRKLNTGNVKSLLFIFPGSPLLSLLDLRQV